MRFLFFYFFEFDMWVHTHTLKDRICILFFVIVIVIMHISNVFLLVLSKATGLSLQLKKKCSGLIKIWFDMKPTLVVQLVDTWRPQNISIVLYLVQNIWTIHDVVGVAKNLQMLKWSRSTILIHVSFCLFVRAQEGQPCQQYQLHTLH